MIANPKHPQQFIGFKEDFIKEIQPFDAHQLTTQKMIGEAFVALRKYNSEFASHYEHCYKNNKIDVKTDLREILVTSIIPELYDSSENVFRYQKVKIIDFMNKFHAELESEKKFKSSYKEYFEDKLDPTNIDSFVSTILTKCPNRNPSTMNTLYIVVIQMNLSGMDGRRGVLMKLSRRFSYHTDTGKIECSMIFLYVCMVIPNRSENPIDSYLFPIENEVIPYHRMDESKAKESFFSTSDYEKIEKLVHSNHMDDYVVCKLKHFFTEFGKRISDTRQSARKHYDKSYVRRPPIDQKTSDSNSPLFSKTTLSIAKNPFVCSDDGYEDWSLVPSN